MTRNQIAFWTLQETKRNNSAQLSELNRHNLESESQMRSTLAESVRHNKMTEATAVDNLNELMRSNRESESIRRKQNELSEATLQENVRHNKAYEAQQSVVAEETERSNRAREAVQNQQNVLKAQENDIKAVDISQQGTFNDIRNLHDQYDLIERGRTNRANENIRRESNVWNLLGNLSRVGLGLLAK